MATVNEGGKRQIEYLQQDQLSRSLRVNTDERRSSSRLLHAALQLTAECMLPLDLSAGTALPEEAIFTLKVRPEMFPASDFLVFHLLRPPD